MIPHYTKPKSASALMSANVFSVVNQYSNNNIHEIPTIVVDNSIKRSSIGRNIPGHTPMISDNINIAGNDNRGKFARLPKPAPVKVFGHNL